MNPLRKLIVLPLFLVSAFTSADPVRTSTNDRTHLAITIANQDLALVKDRRTVHMNAETTELAWIEVSPQIRPETALLRSIDAPGSVRVIEQNFEQTLLSPAALLEKHVGKTVSVIRTNPATGAESVEKAEVLTARDGVVLKFGNRIETGVPGRLAFDAVPPGLRNRPEMIISLDNRGPARQALELDYLTGGMSWKADYVAELSPAGDRADLTGSFTIANATGMSFRNAKLQLIAGDMNRVHQTMPMMAKARADLMAAPAPENVSQESFSDYHLYTINRPVTLAENQTKQISLVSASGVPVRREWLLIGSEYLYRSAQPAVQKPKVSMFIEFGNSRDSRLGMPLPRGTVRIYARDAEGQIQYAGEDMIDHTPAGEKVRLKLGNAFDLTAQRRQTDFVRIAGSGRQEYAYESGHEIVLKNAKREAVTVKVQETLPGDWQMLSESHPHEKLAANTAVWHIRVPAQGQAKLAYRVLAKN